MLLALAILMQTLDASYSCYKISQGYVELNPVLGNTCKSIVSRKALAFTPLVFWNNKYYKISLITSGGLGFGLTIALDK